MRAVLLDGAGRAIGTLPVIDVRGAWWPDTTGPVSALREHFGLEAVVLRLLEATAQSGVPGAEVTYAVEPVGAIPPDLPVLLDTPVDLGDETDPRRMSYARPGGVAQDINWAEAELAARARPRTGAAEQIRSWNLSLLVRLPTAGGPVWLKHVPAFMRHEAAIISLIGELADVPPLVAADHHSGRCLLEEVPGEDAYAPSPATEWRMVTSLVRLQTAMGARVDDLLATACPDWRAASMLGAVTAMCARPDVRTELTRPALDALDKLVAAMPGRLAALADCGLPETLVHGDFHPGNHRINGDRLVLLDWGDSGVGHPLLDMAAFCERVPPARLGRVRNAWFDAWRASCPGSDPERAARLIEPLSALRQALIYRMFLDRIEASERVYHRNDPADWLWRAIRAAQT